MLAASEARKTVTGEMSSGSSQPTLVTGAEYEVTGADSAKDI
jgi:hypothetical protein